MLALAQGDCQPRSRKNPTVRVQSRDGAGHFPFKGRRRNFSGRRPVGARSEIKIKIKIRIKVNREAKPAGVARWAGGGEGAGHSVNPSLGAPRRHPWRRGSRTPTPTTPKTLCRCSRKSRTKSNSPRQPWLAIASALPRPPANCLGWGCEGSRDPPPHGCGGGAYRGEDALLARHRLACVRTPSRQRLGRAAERDLQRVP